MVVLANWNDDQFLRKEINFLGPTLDPLICPFPSRFVCGFSLLLLWHIAQLGVKVRREDVYVLLVVVAEFLLGQVCQMKIDDRVIEVFSLLQRKVIVQGHAFTFVLDSLVAPVSGYKMQSTTPRNSNILYHLLVLLTTFGPFCLAFVTGVIGDCDCLRVLAGFLLGRGRAPLRLSRGSMHRRRRRGILACFMEGVPNGSVEPGYVIELQVQG